MTTGNENAELRGGKGGAAKTQNDPVQAELAELRAQLQALRDKTGTGEENGESRTAPEVSQPNTAKMPASDLSSQVQELAAGLERELKEAKPMTLLAVFAVGVLVGRLLSK
jgi:hypothetical protein